MKNIWKIVIFVSVLITVVLIRECTLLPDYSSALTPYIREISRRSYIDWDVQKTPDTLTHGLKLLNQISETATDRDLLYMTHSIEPVMRVYAALLVKERNGFDYPDLLRTHLNDIAEVEIKTPYYSYRKKVGDFYMLFLYDHLSDKQKESIDSTILYDKTCKLASRTEVMERLSPNPKYYERIRELFHREYQKNALVYLARFQRKQDVTFIQQELKRFYNPNMNEALSAVCEYPEPSFLPALIDLYSLLLQEKLDAGIDSSLLFQALMSYESIKVYALLKNTLREADDLFLKQHAHKFECALSHSNSSFYIPLMGVVNQRKALLNLK